MAETTRRSGRATKGQHRGLEDAEPTPPKKGAGRGKKKQEPDPQKEPEIVRCVCGATEEDINDKTAMICCDGCQAWQHNYCMGLPDDDEELPEEYFCEQCKPDDHKALLKKIKKGDKPWEEQQRQLEQEEEEEKRAKKVKGKKGKRGRSGTTKKDEAETNGTNTNEGDTVMAEAEVVNDTKILPEDVPKSPAPTSNKRKLPQELAPEVSTPSQTEPATKLRKALTPVTVAKASAPPPPPPNRRKSSTQAPPKRDSIVTPFQTQLADRIEELSPSGRQRVAIAFSKQFEQSVQQAQKDGSFSLPEGQGDRAFALKLALSVEYAMYLNFWGTGMQASDQYTDKFRGINFNIKANTALRDRLLMGELSPNDLSKMSRDDMASKELQEKKAEMLKEAEKQHTLIQEDGPRIRRTHKGEEVVGNDTLMADNTEAIFTAPVRKRPSEIDTPKKEATPEAPQVQSPEAVEPTERTEEAKQESKEPLKVDTQASPQAPEAPVRKESSNFNIQDVWSATKAQDPERNRRQSRPSEPPAPTLKQQDDPEVDQLLKDEEPEDEEEYEPTEFPSDPNAPVWHGRVSMQNIAGFSGTGKHAAGANLSATIPWRQLLPSTLTIEGRIHPQKADEYLCGLRYSNTTDLTVVAVTPNENDTDRASFEKLYEYFTGRERYGVITKNPVSNVKDAYVVPLGSGTVKKPEFIELLDDCKIEFPASERMLLLSFVVKMNNSPSAAQQTPHPPEVGGLNSPLSSTANHAPASLVGHAAGFQNSPTPNLPYQAPPQHLPQYSNYVSSPSQAQQGQQAYQPPYPSPNQPQPTPHYGPVGINAARLALGELVNAPAIAELLQEAPNSGVEEFRVVRDLMENVPASRNDYRMLRGMLTQRLQQQQSQQIGPPQQ